MSESSYIRYIPHRRREAVIIIGTVDAAGEEVGLHEPVFLGLSAEHEVIAGALASPVNDIQRVDVSRLCILRYGDIDGEYNAVSARRNSRKGHKQETVPFRLPVVHLGSSRISLIFGTEVLRSTALLDINVTEGIEIRHKAAVIVEMKAGILPFSVRAAYGHLYLLSCSRSRCGEHQLGDVRHRLQRRGFYLFLSKSGACGIGAVSAYPRIRYRVT